MSILIDRGSRVVVQGITGKIGCVQAEEMRAYGTSVVAGVSPGSMWRWRGHQVPPIFDTVADAVAATGADVSCVFVPPAFAADAIMESASAGIPFTVCITEGIPVHDMIRALDHVENLGTRLLGPNCPGLVTPGETKVGTMPNSIHRPGEVGVISRSGTNAAEVIWALTQAGIGQSTSVGIGGDSICGLSFWDVLALFAEDPKTSAVVLVGEIGGSAEEDAAAWIRQSGFDKPVVAFIAGRTAPAGKRLGHAGAIIGGGGGTAQAKIEALRDVGVGIAEQIEDVPRLLAVRMAT